MIDSKQYHRLGASTQQKSSTKEKHDINQQLHNKYIQASLYQSNINA